MTQRRWVLCSKAYWITNEHPLWQFGLFWATRPHCYIHAETPASEKNPKIDNIAASVPSNLDRCRPSGSLARVCSVVHPHCCQRRPSVISGQVLSHAVMQRFVGAAQICVQVARRAQTRESTTFCFLFFYCMVCFLMRRAQENSQEINQTFHFFLSPPHPPSTISVFLLLPSAPSSLSRFGSSSSSFLSKALSPVWAILRHQSVLPAVRIIPLTDRTAASPQLCPSPK